MAAKNQLFLHHRSLLWIITMTMMAIARTDAVECNEQSVDWSAHFDAAQPHTTAAAAAAAIVAQNGDRRQCRNRKSQLVDESLFNWDSCAQCYSFMPSEFFVDQLCYRSSDMGALWSTGKPEVIATSDTANPANASNATTSVRRYFCGDEADRTDIAATFRDQRAVAQWQQCCQKATDCCAKMAATTVDIHGHQQVAHRCPSQWDGWQCIGEAANGTTVDVVCPAHIYFYGDPPDESCPRYAKKECLDDGTWSTWTDYSTCGRSEALKRKLHVHICAYAASLAALLPAVLIFHSYKQLRVPRIRMHTNFFVSLIANATAAIFFMSVFNLDALNEDAINNTSNEEQAIGTRNPVRCKLALTLTKYTRTTTYMWMQCEAFYLHKLIMTAFAEEKRLLYYYITGWGLPFVFVTLYATSRTLWDDEPCWTMSTSYFEWFLNAPMLFSLILNTAFLFNIIHGLVTKLTAANTNEPSHFRKAAKATLVLVPLFGVHYLTVLYLPHEQTCGLLNLYYYFSAALDGLQGFIVSIFFCYSTSEVRTLLLRTYRRHRLSRDPRGRSFNSRASATTQVMSTNDEPPLPLTVTNDKTTRVTLQ